MFHAKHPQPRIAAHAVTSERTPLTLTSAHQTCERGNAPLDNDDQRQQASQLEREAPQRAPRSLKRPTGGQMSHHTTLETLATKARDAIVDYEADEADTEGRIMELPQHLLVRPYEIPSYSAPRGLQTQLAHAGDRWVSIVKVEQENPADDPQHGNWLIKHMWHQGEDRYTHWASVPADTTLRVRHAPENSRTAALIEAERKEHLAQTLTQPAEPEATERPEPTHRLTAITRWAHTLNGKDIGKGIRIGGVLHIITDISHRTPHGANLNPSTLKERDDACVCELRAWRLGKSTRITHLLNLQHDTHIDIEEWVKV